MNANFENVMQTVLRCERRVSEEEVFYLLM